MTVSDQATMDAQVERLRASRIFDRSQSLARLFDYLADSARNGRALREAEVAQDVFGRFGDLSGDASVRVYVHRLRRKLSDFYAGEGADETHRLFVPVGEYRLALERRAEAGALEPPQDLEPAGDTQGELDRHRPFRWAIPASLAGIAVLLAANLAAWLLVDGDRSPSRELAALGRTPLWAGVNGKRPILVVVGDDYIFGERGAASGVQRLVRDPNINSTEDFDEMLMRSPDAAKRYVDVNTYYTPVGATLALQRVLPLVEHAAKDAEQVRLITSSQLTPEMLKSSDVVYVGQFAALRLLEAPVFSRSRFQVNQAYDSMTDRKTNHVYASSANIVRGNAQNDDLGYIATFAVSGRHIVVIAGAHDIGVMQAAEIATDRSVQSSRPPLTAAAEWLYRVRGMGRTPLGGIAIFSAGGAAPAAR